MVAPPEAGAKVREGKGDRYTWRETLGEVEIIVPLPVNTKRAELQVVLLDAATGENLWRTQIETQGGEERFAEGATLRVWPTFWPEPAIEGVLRGSVDAEASSYQMVASSGGAWDSLLISLRKAKAAEVWWGGVVRGEAAPGGASERATPPGGDAASFVMRMAADVRSAAAQEAGALGCVALALDGRAAELVGAKALAQVATAMEAHPEAAELQRAGCALLAAAPMDVNAATTAAVVTSRLLAACVGALWRAPADERLQLQGARALLNFLSGGDDCRRAVLEAEGVALLAGARAQRPPPPPPPPPTAHTRALPRPNPVAPLSLRVPAVRARAPSRVAITSPRSLRGGRRAPAALADA